MGRSSKRGSHWTEPDGIDDGIAANNRIDMPRYGDVADKSGNNRPMRSLESRWLPTGISGTTDGIDFTRVAETPSTQGSSVGLTIEWE
ncbi:hypothetical protein EOS_34535 [Caballeronia mineralivorans PML1(12)]|uniref:Uncharacterized protein n=1 Tax=Caballeronia mineralivorans PML1(12) TaxID=908627 RepID=A0A0J1CMA7_9BURK|nr:hypothetical protein EOS_34535 [Caballeronia mineralivorans PML1(12)]